MLGRLLQELRRLLEHVLALGLVVGGDDVLGGRGLGLGVGAARGLGGRLGPGRGGLDLLERELARRLLDLDSAGLRRGRRRPRGPPARLGSGSGSMWWIGASRRSSAVTSSCSRRVVDEEIVVRDRRGAGSAATGSSTAAGAGSRRAGPSASCSRRATSPGSAPWRRLSSRCSLIASSSSPMAPQTLATQAAIYSWGEASARTVRFLPARLAR